MWQRNMTVLGLGGGLSLSFQHNDEHLTSFYTQYSFFKNNIQQYTLLYSDKYPIKYQITSISTAAISSLICSN